jgi:hypothetical protein
MRASLYYLIRYRIALACTLVGFVEASIVEPSFVRLLDRLEVVLSNKKRTDGHHAAASGGNTAPLLSASHSSHEYRTSRGSPFLNSPTMPSSAMKSISRAARP